jgi:hypothetical protein
MPFTVRPVLKGLSLIWKFQFNQLTSTGRHITAQTQQSEAIGTSRRYPEMNSLDNCISKKRTSKVDGPFRVQHEIVQADQIRSDRRYHHG